MPESNVFNPFELSLSEKQIPRFVGNISSYKKWTELLESRGVRPRQARYQAALRPDMKCIVDSKALSNFAATPIPRFCGDENVFARDPSTGVLPATPCLPHTRSRIVPRNRSFEIRLPVRLWSQLSSRLASGIKVPKPSAGIWPAPRLSGILVIRRSEDSIIGYTSKLFCVRHHRPDSKTRCRAPQTGRQFLISRTQSVGANIVA